MKQWCVSLSGRDGQFTFGIRISTRNKDTSICRENRLQNQVGAETWSCFCQSTERKDSCQPFMSKLGQSAESERHITKICTAGGMFFSLAQRGWPEMLELTVNC